MPRLTFQNMTLTRHTTYEVAPRYAMSGNINETLHRYQFADDEGKSYVWTTAKEIDGSSRVGDCYALIASVKCQSDGFGFCRLSRVRVVGRGRVERML